MNIIQEAFEELFPEKEFYYEPVLRYSGKFSSYNANIRLNGRRLELRLSRSWKSIGRGIKKGLIQSLILKLLGNKKEYSVKKIKTLSMDLYETFLKNAHLGAEKHTIDPFLEMSFDRLNNEYFNSMLDKPNLIWGSESKRKLGSYEYGSDTIMISAIFRKAPVDLLDLVMYHEMLHKRLKFDNKNGRSLYHTKEFRRRERLFKGFEEKEKELEKFLKRLRIRSWLPF